MYNKYLKDSVMMLIKTKYNANIYHNKLWRNNLIYMKYWHILTEYLAFVTLTLSR